ncbi:MAG: hypothetical protein TECD_00023 [Hyphomicrobiaceae bacterium hypho_1]
MNELGKKLSGRQLRQFLITFFQTQDDIDPVISQRVVRILIATFSSVILKRYDPFFINGRLRGSFTSSNAQKQSFQPMKKSLVDESRNWSRQSCSTPSEIIVSHDEEEFDPYAFALVSVFVREGPDGLMKRLNTIKGLENLRSMARLQQIALPPEFRYGDVSICEVKSAIVSAVCRRVADRRAAAG